MSSANSSYVLNESQLFPGFFNNCPRPVSPLSPQETDISPRRFARTATAPGPKSCKSGRAARILPGNGRRRLAYPQNVKRKLLTRTVVGRGLMSSRASFKRLGDTKTVSLGLPSCFRDDTMNSARSSVARRPPKKAPLSASSFVKHTSRPEFLVFRVSGV